MKKLCFLLLMSRVVMDVTGAECRIFQSERAARLVKEIRLPR